MPTVRELLGDHPAIAWYRYVGRGDGPSADAVLGRDFQYVRQPLVAGGADVEWVSLAWFSGPSAVSTVNREAVLELEQRAADGDPERAEAPHVIQVSASEVLIWAESDDQPILDLLEGLERYPVVDDDALMQVEADRQAASWEAWGRREFAERLSEEVIGVIRRWGAPEYRSGAVDLADIDLTPVELDAVFTALGATGFVGWEQDGDDGLVLQLGADGQYKGLRAGVLFMPGTLLAALDHEARYVVSLALARREIESITGLLPNISDVDLVGLISGGESFNRQRAVEFGLEAGTLYLDAREPASPARPHRLRPDWMVAAIPIERLMRYMPKPRSSVELPDYAAIRQHLSAPRPQPVDPLDPHGERELAARAAIQTTEPGTTLQQLRRPGSTSARRTARFLIPSPLTYETALSMWRARIGPETGFTHVVVKASHSSRIRLERTATGFTVSFLDGVRTLSPALPLVRLMPGGLAQVTVDVDYQPVSPARINALAHVLGYPIKTVTRDRITRYYLMLPTGARALVANLIVRQSGIHRRRLPINEYLESLCPHRPPWSTVPDEWPPATPRAVVIRLTLMPRTQALLAIGLLLKMVAPESVEQGQRVDQILAAVLDGRSVPNQPRGTPEELHLFARLAEEPIATGNVRLVVNRALARITADSTEARAVRGYYGLPEPPTSQPAAYTAHFLGLWWDRVRCMLAFVGATSERTGVSGRLRR